MSKLCVCVWWCSFEGAVPALLDVAAIAADRVLLLDCFFTVVLFHGSTVAQWRRAGYQHQPEHDNFRALLAVRHWAGNRDRTSFGLLGGREISSRGRFRDAGRFISPV
jgi:hypothetical protein